MVGLGWSWRYDELNCAVGKRGGRHQQGICVTFSLLSVLERERERERVAVGVRKRKIWN